MAVSTGPVTISCANVMSTPRRSSGLSPAMWSNNFIQSLNSEFPETQTKRLEELIEKAKNMLSECAGHLDLLELVDLLQKLGVAYHLKPYIAKCIEKLKSQMSNILEKGDLHHVSILFKLLRNNGYKVSEDIFSGFLDDENHFSTFKCNDHRGILSLYDASFLSHEGENLMDKAQKFARKYLMVLYGNTNNDILKVKISHALKIPSHRRIFRLEVRWFINIYATEEDMNPLLLEFAKLDYNKVQTIHRDEVKRISRWWTELGVQKHINFFRDNVLGFWIWAIGITSFEPRFSNCREKLAKWIALLTVIDDFYDTYDNMNEIEAFTNIVERWTLDGIEELPHYMKIMYLSLFNYINALSYELLRDKKCDITSSMRRMVVLQCKAFYTEAKWYHNKCIPSYVEYMRNGIASSTAFSILGLMYCFGYENISLEVLEKILDTPSFVRQTSIASRLLNDLTILKGVTRKDDGYNFIDCYIHQEKVSKDIAEDYATQTIETTWKKMNKERHDDPTLGDFINDGALNFTRTCHCLYQEGDDFTSPGKTMKEFVTSLLLEDIPMANSNNFSYVI